MNPPLDAAFDHAQTLVARMQALSEQQGDAAPDDLPPLVEAHLASMRDLEPALGALARVLQASGLSDRLSVLATDADPAVAARAVNLVSSLQAAHFSHAVNSSVMRRKLHLTRALALAVQGLDPTMTMPGAARFAQAAERSRILGQA
jgi:hypothetical protein